MWKIDGSCVQIFDFPAIVSALETWPWQPKFFDLAQKVFILLKKRAVIGVYGF